MSGVAGCLVFIRAFDQQDSVVGCTIWVLALDLAGKCGCCLFLARIQNGVRQSLSGEIFWIWEPQVCVCLAVISSGLMIKWRWGELAF